MAMDRFEGAFHQSDLKSYLKCPKAFFYNRVAGLDKEKVSLSNLGGRAGHFAIEMAHRNKIWSPEKLFRIFMDRFEAEKAESIKSGMDLHGQIDLTRFQTMLIEYAARPYNREAELIMAEQDFYFEIKPARTTYSFRGRIDQVVKIPVSTLKPYFPHLFDEWPRDYVIMHRDIKTGKRREVSEIELDYDIQFDIYAYALKYAVFDGFGGAFANVDVDCHVKYFIEDHIPYESDGGEFFKDAAGNFVPCDIVATPCLVGKKQLPCQGKRKFCTKQQRGPGMYFTSRPAARLEQIPKEIGLICWAIRMGSYPRNPNQLCKNFCQFISTCKSEGNFIQAA